MSPAATKGVGAGRHSSPELPRRRKGQALFFDETNRGFSEATSVGTTARIRSRIDFWFYVGAKPTRTCPSSIISPSRTPAARIPPHDRGRPALGLARALAARQHDRDRDESSRCPSRVGAHHNHVRRLEPCGGACAVLERSARLPRSMHDSLTRSMLPWTSADVFDPFLGLAFGTRFREKAPVGSGSTSCAYSTAALTPLEVAFLHDEKCARGDARRECSRRCSSRPTRRSSRRARRSTAARAARERARDAVPQVLVMGDAPEPVPTFVLNRGVYSAPGERVSRAGSTSVSRGTSRCRGTGLGLAQWLFDPKQSAHRPRVRQPHVADALRPRHRRDAEDFGSQGSIPTHPGAARLARRRVRRVRLGHQSAASADRDVGHLSADRPNAPMSCSRAMRATSCTRAARAGG